MFGGAYDRVADPHSARMGGERCAWEKSTTIAEIKMSAFSDGRPPSRQGRMAMI